MERSPGVLERHIDRGVGRGALELSREMRKEAPKAFSTMTQSIGVNKPGDGIRQVTVGQEYGIYVEEGAGPGGFPPLRSMMDWIRVKRIRPDDDSMSERDLAFVIARSIARKGTPAQPFASDSTEKMEPRIHQIVGGAIDDGLREVGLA